MTSPAAIKLINFLVSLRRLPPLSKLSGEEERLLFELYTVYQSKGSMWVSDVYDIGGGKSASTAYRNLMSLKNKGLINVAVDDGDRRKRQVTFTKTAEQLFDAMN